MWSAGRYVRCQAYASGPMSVPEASHDNCLQKTEKCHVLMARSMHAWFFEKSERNGDTRLISGVHPMCSPAAVKAFRIVSEQDIGRFQFVQICVVRYPSCRSPIAIAIVVWL